MSHYDGLFGQKHFTAGKEPQSRTCLHLGHWLEECSVMLKEDVGELSL